MGEEKRDYLAGLPDLPPLKTPFSKGIIPQVEDKDELHDLPSFPNTRMSNVAPRAIIKEVVRRDGVKDNVEMNEWSPTKFSDEERMPKKSFDNGTRDTGEGNYSENKSVKFHRDFKGKPEVFVKIEKFYSAKKTIMEVREKLNEIDGMINKVREIKLREEQELSSWEKDLGEIKNRLREVTSEIFEKVE